MTENIAAIKKALAQIGLEVHHVSGQKDTSAFASTKTTTFYFYDEEGSIKIRKAPLYSLNCKTMQKDLDSTVKYINRYVR